MSLCHCWGLQPHQTASHIHISHIQRVWAHWNAAHWHTAAAFIQSYTYPTWLRLWGSGSLVESNVITSWLRLRATSNCFPHPHWTYTKCLSALICCSLAYSTSQMQLYQPYLNKILGFWVTCGVKLMSLQTASHIHISQYKAFEYSDMLSIGKE